MMRLWKLLLLSCLFGLSMTAVIYLTLGRKILKYAVNALNTGHVDDNVERPRSPLAVDRQMYLKGVHSDVLAKDLFEKVRVFCFVPVHPRSLATKAAAVRDTWIKKCNKFLFLSSVNDPHFPTVKIQTGEGLDQLTEKVMTSFAYVHDHHLEDADWFLKADDDTYILMENLRYLLSHYNPKDPLYFGHHFKKHVGQGYMSGGGGYVLSKEALVRLVTQGQAAASPCKKAGGAEDVAIGKCMELLDVKPGLSLDIMDRETFHPFNLKTYLYGQIPDWYKGYSKYDAKMGEECCSAFSISFHFVDHEVMRLMHFLIYNIQVYGIEHGAPAKDAFYRE